MLILKRSKDFPKSVYEEKTGGMILKSNYIFSYKY